MNGEKKGKKKRLLLHFKLRTVPAESCQDKECTVLIRDGMKLWHCYTGKIKSGYFFYYQFVCFFLLFSQPLQFPNSSHHVRSHLWRCLGEFFFWALKCPKKKRRREVIWNPKKNVSHRRAGKILCAVAQCPVDHAAHTGAIWRLRPWSCRLIWFPW